MIKIPAEIVVTPQVCANDIHDTHDMTRLRRLQQLSLSKRIRIELIIQGRYSDTKKLFSEKKYNFDKTK